MIEMDLESVGTKRWFIVRSLRVQSRSWKDPLGEEIPVLFELDIRPISVRLMLTGDEDSSKGRSVVGKDVASVEQLLVEELEESQDFDQLLRSLAPKKSSELTSNSFSFVSKHSFVHVLRKLS